MGSRNRKRGAAADLASDPKLTVKEVASRLGVSPQTVYREIAAERLGCYWVGSSIRVGLNQVNSYLALNTRNQESRTSTA